MPIFSLDTKNIDICGLLGLQRPIATWGKSWGNNVGRVQGDRSHPVTLRLLWENGPAIDPVSSFEPSGGFQLVRGVGKCIDDN